jgi:tetratricopeptide (TPR) repeat protein
MTRIGIALLLSAAVVRGQTSAQHAIQLNDQGNRTSDAGDYMGAAGYYRQAVQIWRDLGPVYEAHLAGTLTNLGTVLCGAGHREKGSEIFQEALALHRRTLGAHHIRTLGNMNLLAVDYLMLGDVARAEAMLDEALPILRQEYPDDLQTSRALEVMSGILNRRGKLRESLPPAEEAHAIVVRVAGDESLEAALSYTTVAEAHRALDQLDRALPLYRKAHVLYEKFLGANHPRVASISSQEGLVYMEEGKLALAEQFMVKGLEILQNSCPACNVERAVGETNLGILRLRQKRYREADAALSSALARREEFSAQASPEMAGLLRNLAQVRKLEHREADAARLNQRAAAMAAFQ